MIKKIPVRTLAGLKLPSISEERFKIRRVEDIIGPVGLVHDLHRHDFYFILAIRSGRGEHEIDFEFFSVKEFNLFFLRPGQVHRLSLAVGSKGFLLEFNNEFYHPNDKRAAERLLKASYKNFCALEADRFDRLSSVLELMMEEFNTCETGFEDAVRSALDIFFIEFLRQGSGSRDVAPVANSYVQERFEELLSLLDQHITDCKQVSDYASMMNLSTYQLGEISKSSVGKTVSELINERILLEAKRYLIATTSQVKEVAELLGYDDPSYFIRFFKKHMGYSPEAFRQNSR
ncbi:helix-turn-helix transcriptional regulator [Pedobacter heparinus]|uniref:helix-turn-helix transcriptional regulator n=1 Tax=Pedobacter heparinus TaxID=984 RepID=UPI00292F2EA3|nr:helix-turn-helix transcriptional regulator [Pedobacter heparinus]